MNSILSELNENDTVKEIRQELKHPTAKNKTWVLVEGITDQKLFSGLMDRNRVNVEMVYSGGIEKLRETVAILTAETKQVIGIRDADFLHLNQQTETIPALFVTDYHDSEMMIMSCDTVFSAVINDHLPQEKDFKKLRVKILKSLVFISTLRWLNNLDNIGLYLDKMRIKEFYDNESDLFFNKNAYLTRILQRSANEIREITADEINIQSSKTSDYLNLCQGHDFIQTLAFCINQNIKDKELENTLRISYRKEDFQQTKLYQSLKNWQDTNSQFLFSY